MICFIIYSFTLDRYTMRHHEVPLHTPTHNRLCTIVSFLEVFIFFVSVILYDYGSTIDLTVGFSAHHIYVSFV
jgi:hypothetical protein